MTGTGGLTFRPWRARDVDDLAPHASNPNIWLNLNDAESWIGVNPLLVGPPIHFTVDLDGSPVGGVGIELPDDDTPTAKIGYWVAESYRGRGIGGAAVVRATSGWRRVQHSAVRSTWGRQDTSHCRNRPCLDRPWLASPIRQDERARAALAGRPTRLTFARRTAKARPLRSIDSG